MVSDEMPPAPGVKPGRAERHPSASVHRRRPFTANDPVGARTETGTFQPGSPCESWTLEPQQNRDSRKAPGTRAWALTRGLRDRRRERAAGRALLAAAALLACWTVWLGASLPPNPLRQQWSTAFLGLDNYGVTWVGLDCLEILGLAVCGWRFARGSADARTCALLTAPLFVLDAWFDVLTAVSRTDLAAAAVSALGAELPTAAVLGWAAWKAGGFGPTAGRAAGRGAGRG
jgi:hypothetical protein